MKDKKHDDQSDKTLLFIIVSIFVMVWLNKQIPIWIKYALEHKFLFGFIFSSFITSTYMLIKWRVQKNKTGAGFVRKRIKNNKKYKLLNRR